MDFDKLREQWHREEGAGFALPENLERIKEAQTPVDKVRCQMRQEFRMQGVVMLAFAFLPGIVDFSSKMTALFVFFYGLCLVFMVYYYYKFYTFYRHSYNLAFDSRKNLMWFYYELKLNIELYKALTFIMFFIGMCFGVLAGTVLKDGSGHPEILDKVASAIGKVAFFASIMILMLVSLLVAELWPRYYYGRHLEKIKTVLDQLDE